ncbi:MAG: riboflavin biosynthesis protein RibF [Candidatus Krumholzibacteria bacterium]|nr:riboflavin biosynthesis protein RibF [Candidatus Krumholzibacteria bacterium]
MRIILNPDAVAPGAFVGTAVTIGVFDGIHRGHAEVIRTLVEVKRLEKRSASILLTFDTHPLAVTHPEMVPPLLMTLDEKLHVLGQMDVDCVVVEHFSKETAAIDFREYIAGRLVGRLGMKHLVVGYDLHLGRGREGSQARLVEEARRLDFAVTVVPPVVIQGSVVSSTKIRRDISERRLDHAARCLARPYFFEGEVVRGEGVGRSIGFPTANAAVASRAKLLPPGGVYAVEVDAGERRYGGMMNIGSAPTIHKDGERHVEVHLFDFEGDLVGERIRVHCLQFMREERRFGSIEELRAQLMHDRVAAYAILEKKH